MATTTDPRHEPGFEPGFASAAPRAARREPPRSITPVLLALAGVLLAAGILYVVFRPQAVMRSSIPPLQPQASAPAAVPPTQRPMLEPPPAPDPLAASAIEPAIVDVVGRDAIGLLQLTDFPRRFAATVDNLGRDHAPVLVWPVRPTNGRFTVEGSGPAMTVAAGNSQRYAPFVAFAGSVDAAKAVALYQRMYPVLQQAWRELGYPNQSLHQRLLDVIALLLATPHPAQPPQLTHVEVKGPVPSSRPWTRYEFADPALQQLAAGQKILLRLAPAQRQVLEAKLRELREELLRISVPAPAR